MTAIPWQQLNAWAQPWADYMLAAIVDASVGLVVVLAIWCLVRRHVPARWCYLLFLLVPLKMLVPLDLPLLPVRTAFDNRERVATAEVLNGGQPSPSPPLRRPPSSDLLGSQASGREGVVHSDSRTSARVLVRPTWAACLMLGWAAVVFVLLGGLIRNQLRLLRRLRGSRLVAWTGGHTAGAPLGDGANRQTTVPVWLSDEIDVPAVVGLMHPRIVLPARLFATLPERQIACIIAHESAHMRWCDVWVALVERLVRIVHFANPALWIAAHWAHVYRETACDDASLEATGMDRRLCGATLLGVLEFAQYQRHVAAPAVAMFERARFQKQRLQRIMAGPALTRRMGWQVSLLLLVAAGVVLPNLRPAARTAHAEQVAPAAGESRALAGQEPQAADKLRADPPVSIAAGGPLSEETYDLIDVVRNRADIADLAALIPHVVLPRTWSTVGRAGTVQADSDTLQLHIKQCAGAHTGVQRLLATLGTVSRAQAALVAGESLPAPRAFDLILQDRQVTRLYSIPSLLYLNPAVRDPGGADYDELIRVTTGVVGSDSWDEVGGPGTINVWPNGSCVIISQSAENHAQIGQLYAALHTLPAINAPGRRPAGVGGPPFSQASAGIRLPFTMQPPVKMAGELETRVYALHDLLPAETTPAFPVSPRAVGMEQLTAWLWKQAGPQPAGDFVGLNLFRTKGALVLTAPAARHGRVTEVLVALRANLENADAEERATLLRPVFAPAFYTLGWGGLLMIPEDTRPNRIYLHGACRADDQLAQLEPLADIVQRVQLIETDVTDLGMEKLAQLGVVSSLTVWSDHVTDAGLAKLAAIEGLSDLAIHGAQVTDGAVTTLVQLPLFRLDISHTSITDAGLQAFLAGTTSNRFMELNVRETKVSPAAVEAARTAHPRVRILD